VLIIVDGHLPKAALSPIRWLITVCVAKCLEITTFLCIWAVCLRSVIIRQEWLSDLDYQRYKDQMYRKDLSDKSLLL